MPAERQQAAADEGHVARNVVGEHLAHRVAQQHLHIGRQRRIFFQFRAAAHDQAVRGNQARDLIETLRMARHDHQQRIPHLGLDQRIEYQGLLAIARDRAQQHRTRADPVAQPGALVQHGRRRRDVKLDAAGDAHVGRAELAQACRVGLGLRRDTGQTPGRIADQPRQALSLGQRARRQAGIDQHHRHPIPFTGSHHVRPHFGFHQHADRRRKAPDEAPHQPADVIRQIALPDTSAEQDLAGGAPGRRHAGEQDRVIGIGGQQRVDQRFSGTGFADRYRMHPDHGLTAPIVRFVQIKSEAFRHMLPVAWLLAAAPPQACQHKGQHQPPRGGIEKAYQISLRPISRVRIANGLASGSYWRATGKCKVCSSMY